MIMEKMVSIITPCYNSENYMARYLDTILLQSYDLIELVLINDGSTDMTEQIIMSYENKIKERGYILNYFKQENGGIGKAVDTGLHRMQGEYFCWCDSDNFFDNEYIFKSMKFMLENENYGAVRCNGYVVYDYNINCPVRKMSQGNENKPRNLFMDAILENNFHFGCTLIKTIAFEAANRGRSIYPSRAGQNWQIMLPVFHDYSVGYIDECLFYFVFRNDSVSNAVHQQGFEEIESQQLEHQKIIDETIKKMKLENYEDLKQLVELKYYSKLISFAYALKNYKKCLEYCIKKEKYESLTLKEKIKRISSKINL